MHAKDTMMKPVPTILWVLCTVLVLGIICGVIVSAPAQIAMDLRDTSRVQGIWPAEAQGAWSQGDAFVAARYFPADTWRSMRWRWRNPPAPALDVTLRIGTASVATQAPADWRTVHVLIPAGVAGVQMSSATVQIDGDRRAIGVRIDAPSVTMMRPAVWLWGWWAIDLWIPLVCAALWLRRGKWLGMGAWVLFAVVHVAIITQETRSGFAHATLWMHPWVRYCGSAVLLWWALRRQTPATVHLGNAHWFGLDVMRAIAVLLVVVHHSVPLLFASVATDRTQVVWLMICGPLGVDLFFALSGYLIGGIVIRIVADLRDFAVVKQFWMRRWLRTLPAAYVSALVLWVVAAPKNIADYFLSIFFMSTINPQDISSEMPFWWSLGVEELFYLLLPLLIYVLIKRTTPMRALGIALAVFVVMSTVNRGIAMALLPSDDWDAIQYTMYTRLDSMVWGVLIAWIRGQRPHWYAELRTYGLGVGMVLITLGVMSYVDAWRWPYVDVVVMHTLLTAGAALLIPAMEHVTTLGWRTLDSCMSWLARVSYSVYLYHFMMVTLLVRLFGPATSWSMLAAVLFLYAVLTLGAAALSYYAVEAPVLRWRDKRYPRQ